MDAEDIPATSTVPVVFDLGAHLGEDCETYLRLGYRVVAIEAHPGHAVALRSRFEKQIADGRLVVVESAIARSRGSVTFYVSDTVSVWGTISYEWAERNARYGAPSQAITVPAVTIADVVERFGAPYYIKIDIEGADRLCLEGLVDIGARPQYLSFECSYADLNEARREIALLRKLGYRKFQIVGQGRHAKGNFHRFDGTSVELAFDEHSSGPFGPHLEGRWLSSRQVLIRFALLAAFKSIVPSAGVVDRVFRRLPFAHRLSFSAGWFDTHASI